MKIRRGSSRPGPKAGPKVFEIQKRGEDSGILGKKRREDRIAMNSIFSSMTRTRPVKLSGSGCGSQPSRSSLASPGREKPPKAELPAEVFRRCPPAP